MTFILNKWWLLSLNFAFSLILYMIWAPTYDLKSYIDSLFYVSYFYLFFGLIMVVLKGRFLDGITYSFRRFRNRVFKNGDYLDDWEQKPLPSEIVRPSILKMFLFQGTVLAVGLVLLLGYFYQM